MFDKYQGDESDERPTFRRWPIKSRNEKKANDWSINSTT